MQQIAIEQLDSVVLIRSLRSDLCPACRGHKRPGQSFCPTCYRHLPSPRQKRLYDRVGAGYEEAIAGAFHFLRIDLFTAPSPLNATQNGRP